MTSNTSVPTAGDDGYSNQPDVSSVARNESTFKLTTIAERDLRGKDFPATEYYAGICLYPVGGTVFLYGPPGIGKSLVQQMLNHTGAWGKTIGQGPTAFTPQHTGNVLYLDFEGSDALAAHRSKIITPEDPDDTGTDIYWHTPTREADGEHWAPTFPERLAQVEDLLTDHEAAGKPISLIVIDTFTCFVGANDSKANAYDFDVHAIKPLNALASKHNICIVLLHHPNKAGEMSGSTGRSGSAWIVAKLDATRRDEQGRAIEIQLTMDKNRMDRERSFTFSREYTDVWTFETDMPALACQFKGNARRVWELLVKNGAGTREQIVKATGYTPEGVKTMLRRLREKGLAQVDGETWSAIGKIHTEMPKMPVHRKETAPPIATTLTLDTTETDPKKAIPTSMKMMWDSIHHAGRRYHPVMFTDTPKEVGDIWEGKNAFAMEMTPDSTVVVLDKNGAYLGAANTHLPIGNLTYDTEPGYDPKRSGYYLVDVRKDLPLGGPFHKRDEEGRVWVTTPVVKALLKHGAVPVYESWTAPCTEVLLRPWYETLRDLRKHAQDIGDAELATFIKMCYSKVISTMGDSTSNFEIRRPDWMHIIRSQSNMNLWNAAKQMQDAGLNVVKVSNNDEIWIEGSLEQVEAASRKQIFTLGKHLGAFKVKRTFVVGEEQ